MRDTWGRPRLLAALLLVLACSAHAQPPSRNATADLGDTAWQLVKFQGSDDATLIPDSKAKYTVAFGADGRVSVRIDCNRGSGTWKSPGSNQLGLGPLALARAMCPPAPLTDRIVKDWEFVRSYTLKDGHLFLSLMADGGSYEFEPVTREGSMAGVVKGTATYRERMALPPDAVLEVTLEDVSKADTAAEVIGRARLDRLGSPPFRFEITYDPARIIANHRYAVRARILVDGKLFMTSDQSYPVLTAGQGNAATLLLRRAGSSAPVAEGAARPAPTAY
jgi:uncharacterized lipoprotein YbaY/heat shock protein HslJ